MDFRFNNHGYCLHTSHDWRCSMKMHCKNCGIKFYPSENNYVGYPYTWHNRAPAHTRVFHSRGCWEEWTAKNITAYTLWLQGMGNNDTINATNNQSIEEENLWHD